MKWASPKKAETKFVKKFAFWPMYLDNGDLIWLERYYVEYQSEKNYRGVYRWYKIRYFQYDNLAQEVLVNKFKE